MTKLFILFFLASCQNNTKQLQKENEKTDNADKGFTDFNGAMLYEFNMTKNPVTGTIPEGTYEAERAQANEMLRKQQTTRNPTLGSYSFAGPNNLGGRTRTIAYDVRFNGTSNQIILAGGVSGGVYKSIDNGTTWVRKSLTGAHFSCTSLAQDTRVGFQDTWYYGVGESSGNSASGSGASYFGNGVYKSTDNGETWARLTASNASALESFSTGADCIQKVIVDPTDGNVYVACLAKIMRSIDGGTTWVDVLPGVLANSGQTTDIVVSSGGRLYASFGGTNDSGVDGVWVSAPGGTSGDPGSWTRIAGAGAGGSPVGWNAEPAYGRVVLAIAPSSENLLYAMYYTTGSSACIPGSPPTGGATEAELFRWDDIGGTWTNLSAGLPSEVGCLSGNNPFAVQGGYDLVVAVKPDDATVVFIGGTNVYRSVTSGAGGWVRIGGYAGPLSYAQYTGSHPDIHSIVFQPTSSTTMLCGNDGGIQRTTANLAATVAWTPINTGYRTYQYYYVENDPRFGNDKVMGGAQDNGSTRNIGATGTSFEVAWGGDGVSVGLSGASGFEYVGSQLGFIERRLYTTPIGTYVDDLTPTGEGGTGLFVTLFKLDPDNTGLLYYANDNSLYRTTSASTVLPGTWTAMTGIATAVGPANDITALATTRYTYSAATASLFMGTSNGKVFRLDNPTGVASGTGPVDITPGGIAPSSYISSIAVNPRNDDTVLVTISNYGVVSAYWTGSANTAVPVWTTVEGTLTLPSYRSSAIVVTTTGVQYFVGTSMGLYNSTGLPGAVAWAQEGPAEMGNAVVSSLALRPSDNKLLVGTHGYGMWYSFFPIALPITLTEFKGTLQDKNVLLQWSTSTELNSKHFELEKSFDGTNFRKIATVPAAGYSNTTKQYSYVDREPLTEKNYYRLRSVDIDGNFKLSNIVLIKSPGIPQDILVIGNPFKNNIQLRFVKSPETGGELRLTDMAGRLMAAQRFNQGEQQLQFIIPAGKLSKGAYMLQAIINGNRFTKKVQKE
ncbi:MAG: T9SS type A sorting domain-containing protein [Ferruginibacter sp.]